MLSWSLLLAFLTIVLCYAQADDAVVDVHDDQVKYSYMSGSVFVYNTTWEAFIDGHNPVYTCGGCVYFELRFDAAYLLVIGELRASRTDQALTMLSYGVQHIFIEDHSATALDFYVDNQLLDSPSSFTTNTKVDGPRVYGYYGQAGLSPGCIMSQCRRGTIPEDCPMDTPIPDAPDVSSTVPSATATSDLDSSQGPTTSSKDSSDTGLIAGLVVWLVLAAVLGAVVAYLWMRHRNSTKPRTGAVVLDADTPRTLDTSAPPMTESYIVDRQFDYSAIASIIPRTGPLSEDSRRNSKTTDGLDVSPSASPNLNPELVALYERSGRNADIPTLDRNSRLGVVQLDIVSKLLERGMPGEDIATIVRSMAHPARSTSDDSPAGPPSYGGHTPL